MTSGVASPGPAGDSKCGHDRVELPDVLPAPIAAALAIECTHGRGIDERRTVTRLAWALTIAQADDPTGDWDRPAVVCAVLRRSPTVAGHTGVVAAMVCRLAVQLAATAPSRTDIGLAERVAIAHGGDLAWSEDGQFRWWDGYGWKIDDGGALAVEAVKAVVRDVLPSETARARDNVDRVEAQPDPQRSDDEHKAAVAAAKADAAAAFTFANRSASARAVKAALDLVRREPGVHVPADAWDADDRLLAVANGVVELGDAGPKLRGHNRDDRLTMSTRGAYRPGADRSEWEAFVAAVLPDPEVRAYVHRLLGSTLLGGNPHRLLIMLIGPTSSGKSTLLGAIRHALGDYAAPFRLTLFRAESEPGKARPDVHAALPRRVLVASETGDRIALDGDQIKRITGGDADAARTVYSGHYRERTPAFVPILAANVAPRVRGADAALWRRLVVLPFGQTVAPEAEDTALPDRLRDQADAVLMWLIDGFAAYRSQGLGQRPRACVDAEIDARQDMSAVDRWLAEHAEDGDYVEASGDLELDWRAWCQRHEIERDEHLSGPALGKALTARGYGTRKIGPSSARIRARTGLRLRPDRHGGSADMPGPHPPECTCPPCLGEVRPIRRPAR